MVKKSQIRNKKLNFSPLIDKFPSRVTMLKGVCQFAI